MGATYAITRNQLQEEERTLYNPAAERGFLATLMRWPKLAIQAERDVPPEFMNLSMNRYAYEMMLFIYRQASVAGWPMSFDPLNMLFVARQCGADYEKHFMQKTEGMEHVRMIELAKTAVSIESFDQICHTLRDSASRVRIYRSARTQMESAMNFANFPDYRSIALATEAEMADLVYQGNDPSGVKITKMGEEMNSFVSKAAINREYANAGLFNINITQFPFWMSLMNGGFRRKSLSVIAARPKVGKSTLLLTLAIQAACFQGIPVLYMDTEMSREEMYSRGLARVAGWKEHDLLRGRFLEKDPATGKYTYGTHNGVSFFDHLTRMTDAPLYYVNVAGTPVQTLPSLIRQFKNQHVGTMDLIDPMTGNTFTTTRPALVIYDWMKLPDASGLKSAAEHQLLGFLASVIKDAAKENDIPVIAGAQNNRGAIGAEKADWEEMAEGMVAGSDRIAQFCSNLLILRNIDREEAESIKTLGVRPGYTPDVRDHPHNGLMYNQALHYVLQRGGSDWRRGIPLYLNRGMASYEEMYYPHLVDGPGGAKQFGCKYVNNDQNMGLEPGICPAHLYDTAVKEQQNKAKANMPPSHGPAAQAVAATAKAQEGVPM